MILLVSSDLRKAFNSYSDYMWLIFAYETAILALKYGLGILIPDTPYWVWKEIQWIKTEWSIHQEEKRSMLESETILTLKTKLQAISEHAEQFVLHEKDISSWL